MRDLFAKLKGVRRSGDGWTARCPAHVHNRNGRWLLRCRASCNRQAITDATGTNELNEFVAAKRSPLDFVKSGLSEVTYGGKPPVRVEILVGQCALDKPGLLHD